MLTYTAVKSVQDMVKRQGDSIDRVNEWLIKDQQSCL